MKTVAGLALVWLVLAVPAAAQTTLPARPASPAPRDEDERAQYSRWHLGAAGGVTEVARRDVAAGGEFGIRLRKGLHLVVEGGWMGDVVTQSRIDEAAGFAAFVRSAYGVTAQSRMRGNALTAMAGLRLIPDGKPRGQGPGVRPYLMASVGLARVEYNPRFDVDGQDISGAALSIYGVDLGRDLLGTTNRLAYGGGAGLIVGQAWYLDLGVRLTRIHTTDHKTDVRRAVIGFGRRF